MPAPSNNMQEINALFCKISAVNFAECHAET